MYFSPKTTHMEDEDEDQENEKEDERDGEECEMESRRESKQPLRMKHGCDADKHLEPVSRATLKCVL